MSDEEVSYIERINVLQCSLEDRDRRIDRLEGKLDATRKRNDELTMAFLDCAYDRARIESFESCVWYVRLWRAWRGSL